MASPVQCYR